MLRPHLCVSVTILFYIIQGHSPQSNKDDGFPGSFLSFTPSQRLSRTLVPPKYDKRSSLSNQDHVAISQRKKLAEIMKRKYKTYRQKLEETTKEELEAYKKKRKYAFQPKELSFFPANQPILIGRSVLKGSSNSRNILESNTLKQLRSAGEDPGRLRLGSLSTEAHPVIPNQQPRYESLKLSSLRESPESIENVGKSLLDERLGPFAPAKYDPSIVVDFNLLKLTQTSSKRQRKLHSGTNFPGKTITLTSKRPANGQVISRDIGHSITPVNSVYVKTDAIKDLMGEQMSVYISTKSVPKKNSAPDTNSDNPISSEYGPHSWGNDPEAGVAPSEIIFPEMPLEQLNLPQSVRDSLRKYLQPLLVALKPLTKSVPGLPGLDYPILSVVPYTNFYCSNMPWPGFYADTEARCQTWHACDVDGRQSTFLCPNGTVFNQALMVCDWWYNSDCLTAPFLYSLNERLFGYLKEPMVMPYRRITPELLDTIFI